MAGWVKQVWKQGEQGVWGGTVRLAEAIPASSYNDESHAFQAFGLELMLAEKNKLKTFVPDF